MGMGQLAHGGTAGLVIEIVPAAVLCALGLGVWLRGRKPPSAAAGSRHETGVEEGRREGE